MTENYCCKIIHFINNIKREWFCSNNFQTLLYLKDNQFTSMALFFGAVPCSIHTLLSISIYRHTKTTLRLAYWSMSQKKISNISPYRISTYSVCELYLSNYFLAVTAGRNNIVLHKHQSMSNFLGSIQHTIFRCEIRICLLNVKEQTTQYRIHHQHTGNENNYSYLINKPQLSFC